MTHNFVTHHLSHTSLPHVFCHTVFHTPGGALTCVLCGRHGTYGTGLVALDARDARDAAVVLRGRRGTWRNGHSFCVAGVALGNIFVTHYLSQQLCYTQLFTYNFLTRRASTTSFVYPSFPVPLELFVPAYWKKLTCGVVRSFTCIVFEVVELLQQIVQVGNPPMDQTSWGDSEIYSNSGFNGCFSTCLAARV